MSSFVCQTNHKKGYQARQPQEYGLRRKNIAFGSKDGAAEVKRKLESTYPKLVEGGGGPFIIKCLVTYI